MTGSLATAALLTATTGGVVSLLTTGIAAAARRAGVSRPRALAVTVAAGAVLWLCTTALLAESCALSDWADTPPRWQLLPVSVLVTFVLLSLTGTFRQLLAEVPAWQPVALQAFRVFVELAFWRLHAEGHAPAQVTFEGRNFDVFVGLTAPLVAIGIAAGWIGPRVTIVWNLFGLGLLVNAIVTVFTSAPGPLHLGWSGEPFTAIAAWPAVWIPALLAPVALFLHVASIRQSLVTLTRSVISPASSAARLTSTTVPR